jgi:hypothetical protein
MMAALGLGDARLQQRRRRDAGDAEQSEPAHRLTARDDPVGMVLGHLFGQVPLQLCHGLPPEMRSFVRGTTALRA